MIHSIKYLSALCLSLALPCPEASAQSLVSYNHDAAKMNQITVQETGIGGLTPAAYYDLLHRSYQKTAATKNKQSFRTLAGVEAYQQVDLADSIKASLTRRAEVEALNVADRQVDIAWLAESSKVDRKLSDFEKNINRITGSGGSADDRMRWEEYYNMFRTAIRITQDAYMPNAQRKRQYLAIYADIERQNGILISYLVQLVSRSKTAALLSARMSRQDNTATHATEAFNRWRAAGKLDSH